MKKALIDVLFGVLVVVAITVLEFVVTIPFGTPDTSPLNYASFINRELLLTSLPAALVTFLFSWMLKTKTKSDAMRRAVIWTLVVLANYLIIGIGNGNLAVIFSTIGIYTLLICACIGPIAFAKLRRLR